jgi:acyl dehydratase
MLELPLVDLKQNLGREVGPSDWFEVTQERIQRFADVTLDHQWMHVDVERATRERGGTIAHGLLVACLLPMFQESMFRVTGYRGGYSYSFDRLRFVNPVRPGQRVRLRQSLSSLQPKSSSAGSGWLLTLACTVELEGSDRPALVADYLAFYY